MARNKYPEETVKRILVVSEKLFLEKGYENTTIQDIIQSLNGLSKGAIYHHFNSKEEILDVLVDRLLVMYNPFPEVMNRGDLNGLEKLREVTRRSLVEYENSDVGRSNTSLLKNPNILARMIEKGHVLFSPLLQQLIDTGNRDGSIHTRYSAEVSDVLLLLTKLWLIPSVCDGTKSDLLRRCNFLKDILEYVGVPLFDDRLMQEYQSYLDHAVR